MPEVYLLSRLDLLLDTQNPDGGWGYFPGKQSWLEPTAYGILALQPYAPAREQIRRAWGFIQSLSLEDGSYRPNSEVREGTWVTALAVTVACGGAFAHSIGNSVRFLIGTRGAETSLAMRMAQAVHLIQLKLDLRYSGWPWHRGNASWIEPTCHSLIALKKAAKIVRSPMLNARLREGQKMLLSRHCSDGGWNSGTPSVLNQDAPSYPETTAMALLGLQGAPKSAIAEGLQAARRHMAQNQSSLARAWLTIALRIYGYSPPEPLEQPATSHDILLTALEALAHPAGNHQVFRT